MFSQTSFKTPQKWTKTTKTFLDIFFEFSNKFCGINLVDCNLCNFSLQKSNIDKNYSYPTLKFPHLEKTERKKWLKLIISGLFFSFVGIFKNLKWNDTILIFFLLRISKEYKIYRKSDNFSNFPTLGPRPRKWL